MKTAHDTPRITSYLSTETVPLPYCPGCGHRSVVTALDAALVELQLDPHDVVIVTDIGCIGLADRNFTTNAFHGLHGRSITYACGLKLARPELHVIALMGDGACGIGGTHLLNVARRNIGITLLVANNMNYGMTGGQHSVTTPSAMRTASTPHGNLEAPLDICATAAAAGASFVHRATTFDKELPQVIADALREPGFSLVECWELCTAYFAPKNQLKKTELLALLDDLGFALGRLRHAPRPEYAARYRELAAARSDEVPARHPIVPARAHRLGSPVGVVLAGSAGLKIKTAATLFAEAAIACDLHVTQKDDYPITVMTGHSVAHLVLDPEPIVGPPQSPPEHVIVLTPEGLARCRALLARLPASSTVWADAGLELPPSAARIETRPYVHEAKRVGRLGLPMLALGHWLAATESFALATFEARIRARQKPAIAEANAQALRAGAAL